MLFPVLLVKIEVNLMIDMINHWLIKDYYLSLQLIIWFIRAFDVNVNHNNNNLVSY